tara:strand:+ start:460 stop:1086 length:627 start_codon:yes stop_codon:yes gene_type:complete
VNKYIKKLNNFLINEISQLENPLIVEFGVKNGISTNIFLDICKKKNGKLFSIDIDDCSNVSKSNNWTFIKTRDDNFEFLEKKLPDQFDLIYLDTIHTANHVEKIFYHYYQKLKINGLFIIDDISWIPYVKDNYRNTFYCEINNQETFNRILEIYRSNEKNFDLEFSFLDEGLAKIKKNNNNSLNLKRKIMSRKHSIKNLFRKINAGST